MKINDKIIKFALRLFIWSSARLRYLEKTNNEDEVCVRFQIVPREYSPTGLLFLLFVFVTDGSLGVVRLYDKNNYTQVSWKWNNKGWFHRKKVAWKRLDFNAGAFL